MKDLIVKALDEAFVTLEKQVPQTKKEYVYVNISDVTPVNLLQYMQENNIPLDASFAVEYEDSFIGNIMEPSLCYDIDVPTTDKDKLKFKKKRFTSIAWKYVYDSLLNNNYKREGYNTGLLKEFDNTTVYDMYINKEFDRLVKYYSLPFKLIQ